MIRVYKLSNKDVVSIGTGTKMLLLEYENKLFYEVAQKSFSLNPVFKRTGRTFTPEQINKMLEKHNET